MSDICVFVEGKTCGASHLHAEELVTLLHQCRNERLLLVELIAVELIALLCRRRCRLRFRCWLLLVDI